MIQKIWSLLSVLILFSSCCTSKKMANSQVDKLNGSWELNYISGPRIAFEGLYPEKKPFINFDVKEQKVSGNTSCNSFNGKLFVEHNKIDFNKAMAMTQMACVNGQGEQVFMNTIEKINSYSVSEDGKTLTFISGDIALMRFSRK